LHPVVQAAWVGSWVDQLFADAGGKLAWQCLPIGVDDVIPDRFFINHSGKGWSAIVHVGTIRMHCLQSSLNKTSHVWFPWLVWKRISSFQ
jgi:hypothetical protein